VLQSKTPIALRPGNRTGRNPQQFPSRKTRPPGLDPLANRIMHGRIPHHPALADMFRPGSNCGLISATANAPSTHKAKPAGKTVCKPMKLASHTSASIGSAITACVKCRALFSHKPSPADQSAASKPAAHARHPPHAHARPVMQQHIGKPAGRRANIQTNPPSRAQPKIFQPMRQLYPRAKPKDAPAP